MYPAKVKAAVVARLPGRRGTTRPPECGQRRSRPMSGVARTRSHPQTEDPRFSRFGTILRGVANGVPYALASERLLDQDLDENQAGADVAERDERFGATALDWAGWTKQEAVVAYLKSVATRREKFRP